MRKLRVAVLMLAAVTLAAAFGDQLQGRSRSTAFTVSTDAPASTAEADLPVVLHAPSTPPLEARGPAASGPAGVLGPADGAVADGTTAFDDVPGVVAELDADLLGALRRAAADAENAGVRLLVDSGWRSPEYQRRLLDEAIAKYGSEAAARRWVATPDTSAHVTGDAVDIGPPDAAAWLSEHGAGYGLCQTYANEPWHFELRPEAIGGGCPAMYADAAHDPRMQENEPKEQP